MFAVFHKYTGMELINRWWVLLFVYPTLTVPFCTWVMIGYFASIPREFDEAALIDGANYRQVVTRIFIPVTLTGIIASAMAFRLLTPAFWISPPAAADLRQTHRRGSCRRPSRVRPPFPEPLEAVAWAALVPPNCYPAYAFAKRALQATTVAAIDAAARLVEIGYRVACQILRAYARKRCASAS